MVHDEEIVAARSTYGSFITLLKVGTIASIIAAAFVILIIQ